MLNILFYEYLVAALVSEPRMAIKPYHSHKGFISHCLCNPCHSDLAETAAQLKDRHALIDQFSSHLGCLIVVSDTHNRQVQYLRRGYARPVDLWIGIRRYKDEGCFEFSQFLSNSRVSSETGEILHQLQFVLWRLLQCHSRKTTDLPGLEPRSAGIFDSSHRSPLGCPLPYKSIRKATSLPGY